MQNYAETIFRLIEYELWCNTRAVDFLATLAPEECHRDFGFGLRTPHRTMFHIGDVLRGWSRSVAPVIERPSWAAYDPGIDLDDIKATLEEAGAYCLEAARASHERGVLADDRRLHQVFHLVTHGTHHRGQLLSMMTLMGHAQPFEGGDFGGWSSQRMP